MIKAAYLISGDTAPVFYKNIRIGRYGRELMMYKFRTMVPGELEMHNGLTRTFLTKEAGELKQYNMGRMR